MRVSPKIASTSWTREHTHQHTLRTRLLSKELEGYEKQRELHHLRRRAPFQAKCTVFIFSAECFLVCLVTASYRTISLCRHNPFAPFEIDGGSYPRPTPSGNDPLDQLQLGTRVVLKGTEANPAAGAIRRAAGFSGDQFGPDTPPPPLEFVLSGQSQRCHQCCHLIALLCRAPGSARKAALLKHNLAKANIRA